MEMVIVEDSDHPIPKRRDRRDVVPSAKKEYARSNCATLPPGAPAARYSNLKLEIDSILRIYLRISMRASGGTEFI